MNKKAELARFELFLERIDRLKSHSLIRDGKLRVVKSMRHTSETEGVWSEVLDVNGEPIDIEIFESLVIRLRLFLIPTDSIYIDKVIFGLHQFAPAEYQEMLINAYHDWKTTLANESNIPKDNTSDYTIEEVLNSWLYGEVIHSQSKSRKLVKDWHLQIEGESIMIANFLINIILRLEGIVRQAVSEQWHKNKVVTTNDLIDEMRLATETEKLNQIGRTLSHFKNEYGNNLSVGFLTELLVANHLELELVEGTTHKGYDAISNDGVRYQIKYRAKTTPNLMMNNFEFDFVVLAVLNDDYQLESIWQMPVATAEELAYLTSKGKQRITVKKFKANSSKIL